MSKHFGPKSYLSPCHLLKRSAALGAIVSVAALSSCAAPQAPSPLIGSEPAAGAVITDRLPRTLRLYYSSLPNVEASTVTLTGPEGEYTLRGLHTMGADDLMMEIYRPGLTNGEYTVQWQTQVEGDSNSYSGAYSFEVAQP
jgi:methionine-rich copper-binding protein CopC